ncbi:MAG: fused MFS/spermidine synthase [Limisphaerales bacterium]
MRPSTPNYTRQVLFLLFFLSGFSSLVYQVVWTRLAFASFGIITPVLSVVLSVFMLGLAVGSWLGGRFIARLTVKTGLSAIMFYALAELTIGLGAFAVPKLFAAGERLLLVTGQTNSVVYLSLSALVLAISILPWCVCMGTTFPFMMAYVREQDRQNASSFSFLYLANVLGAMSGTFLTAIVLVEMFGFHHTLWIAAAGNFAIAAIGGWLGRGQRAPVNTGTSEEQNSETSKTLPSPSRPANRLIKWILFSTGFSALAMEVVWTRTFSPVLKTQVYSFALIVFTYLGATFIGSLWYRFHLRKNSPCPIALLIALLVVATFLPGVVNDPQIVYMDWGDKMYIGGAILLLASIVPLCAILGYLTPGLIDEYAGGHPGLAGEAYAINVLGCILGPLFAGYVLLPWMSERYALMILSLPFLGFYFIGWKSLPFEQRMVSGLAASGLAIYSLFVTNDFQYLVSSQSSRIEVRRDYAASVISANPPDHELLLVNGIGMTTLSPITKFMVHLPLAFHKDSPQSALIICFGMGTSFRSALSWNIDTTAVELVPSVTKAFGYYHADAAQVLSNPKGHIVIDDGRRFLRRTREKFDVIVIDPPPPIETAGSSLLYSTEFYDLTKQHLKPHGILQAWIPRGELPTIQAICRSVHKSFPYVRCFVSVEDWGMHMLASMDPIEPRTAEELAARLPDDAKKDLLEWSSTPDLPIYINQVLSREVAIKDCLNPNPEIRITDDHPFNEYFLLRQWKLTPY